MDTKTSAGEPSSRAACSPIEMVCPEHGQVRLSYLTNAHGPLEFILCCGCLMVAEGCDSWRKANNSMRVSE